MNSVVWLSMVACIGGSLAGILPVNPGGIGGLFRGPNSEVIIRGPDGSEITSEHIGGIVQTEPRLEPIIVPDYPDDQIAISSVTVSPAETISISNKIEGAVTPQIIPIEASAHTIPALALPTHGITDEEPHIIETELVDAPEVEPNQSSDLQGPSGSITVRGSSAIISGPASTTITEPVRKIPLATVPIAAPPPAVPSAVLIPPSPTVNVAAVDSIHTNIASDVQSTLSLNTNLVPPAPPNVQFSLTAPSYSLQPPTYPSLNTELVPPPPPNSQSLSGTLTGIADASPVSSQRQSVSSTPIPPESLPPNAIDLGQTIVSTTQRSTVAPSTADIDVGRINLGLINTQQSIRLPTEQSIPSTVSPINEFNIVSSTSVTVPPLSIQSSPTPQVNRDIPLSAERPLFTTASDIQASSNLNPQINISPTHILSGPDLIITPNGADGRTYSQDQSLITNQIISNTARPLSVESNLISSTRAPTVDVGNNVATNSWLRVEPDHILPTASSSLGTGNSGPISTILDTVLVQPTDPKNREVIEFNGKQLENVGNIVPVLHQPVLVAGGLTHIHNIPTASVSQLTSRNDFNTVDYNRYERQTRDRH